jgi:hypothetical protein
VTVKQLRYILVTPMLKQLYLSEETTSHMRLHKEEKRDSEDPDIMSYLTDSEAWEVLNHFDPEFAWDFRSVRLGFIDRWFPTSQNLRSVPFNVNAAYAASEGTPYGR